jgi:hypothetical protein
VCNYINYFTTLMPQQLQCTASASTAIGVLQSYSTFLPTSPTGNRWVHIVTVKGAKSVMDMRSEAPYDGNTRATAVTSQAPPTLGPHWPTAPVAERMCSTAVRPISTIYSTPTGHPLVHLFQDFHFRLPIGDPMNHLFK